MKEKSIFSEVINATKWASFTEVIAKMFSPITNMIMARILAPEAFGVIATVNMVISFADMLTDTGFQKYMVQHDFKNNNEKYENANVAFWTNFVISGVLWLAIVIFRNQIAVLVGNPGLGNVIAIACVQLMLTSFSSIQMALYRRDFDFRTLFLVRMVSVCIPFVITIPLALLGLKYWSLIIGSILTQFSNVIILTTKSKWKPKFFYNLGILKGMLSFSIWSLIEAISIWFTVWVDVFFVGTTFSQYYLGLYKTSTVMVNLLMSLIIASTAPVLFSALSRLKKDEDQFKHMFFKTQRFASSLVFPLGFGIYLYSDLITKILLGSKWSEASKIIGIYALTNSILIVFGYYCSEVYRAKGRPKLSFFAQVLHLVVLIPTCIISSKYGFWVFVYARSWIVLEFVLVHLIIMKAMVGVSILKTIKNVLPTFISAASMGIFSYFIEQVNSGLIWDIISIIISALFYLGILYLFPDMRKDINKIVMQFKYRLSASKHIPEKYKQT